MKSSTAARRTTRLRIALTGALCLYGGSNASLAQSLSSVLKPLGAPPVPAENPMTEAKVMLGKALFWDEQLSRTGTVACGTCHRPMWSGTDPRTALAPEASTNPGPNGRFGDADDVLGSAGVPSHRADGDYVASGAFGFAPQVGGRKSPSVVNAAFAASLFWDGRAGSAFDDPATGAQLIARGGALESQALLPLVDTAEMGHPGNVVAAVGERIVDARPLALASDVPVALAQWIGGRGYPALFAEAFGTPQLSAARIAFAIASYERTLVADRTPLDAELSGTPSLTALERRGAQVFVHAGCAECHGGALMSDDLFHYIGVRPAAEDPGRAARTGNPAHLGAFRTPPLRDVAARPPYMHDGSLPSLEAVVDFYDRGGDFDAPNKSPFMRPLGLGADDRTALLAFLRRPLTDARVAAELPPFDRPTLFTESGRVPSAIDDDAPARGSLPVALATIEPAPSMRTHFREVEPARPYGNGTAGTSGRAPAIHALEPPLFGNVNFTVVLSGARSGAAATLIVSTRDPGIAGNTSGPDARSLRVVATGTGPGDGYASAQLALTDPAWRGRTLYARFYVDDPGARRGRAVTPAVRFTVFDQ